MKRLLSAVAERILRLPKGRRFAVFLILAALVGAIGSGAVYLAVLRVPAGRPVKIAVIAPLSGPDAPLGRMLRDGAAQWIADRSGPGLERNDIALVAFDAASAPDAASRAAADTDVVAIIGPPAPTAGDAPQGVPRLAPFGPPAGDGGWSFPLAADPIYEARFLANYVRNVLGERLVSIIRPEGDDQAAVAAAFDETLQRFGTRVVYQWPIGGGGGEALRAALRERAARIAAQPVAGAILVLGGPDFAAETFSALGEAEVGNRVIGLRALATEAFRARLRDAWRGPGSLAAHLNGTLLTTPLLIDTAGARAQAFQARFHAATGQSPDWLAMLGYDAARMIDVSLAGVSASPGANGAALRAGLREQLLRHRSVETSVDGLAGPLFFDARDGGSLPTLIGTFDGRELVAAPIQLTPIRDMGVSNYLEQLAAGRVLYVNDRFMYKTNVVPVGIHLEKIANFDPAANTADLEFVLWFRWRGGATPSEVIFENAAQPIALGPPERSTDDGDQHYRAWRVRGKFLLNFSNAPHPYGSQMVDITFRHRTLAENNLMFVADIVGMNIAAPPAAASTGDPDTGWLASLERLTGSPGDHASALLNQIHDDRVLAGARGWIADQAAISQELLPAGTDGDPSYVGFGKPPPVFSTLSMDVLAKPDAIDLRGLVPDRVLVYLAIFALSGSALAHLLDRRDRGQFWRMQTLVLRLVCWPVLLAAASALTLDYAVAHASLSVVESIDFISRAAWWLAPAHLLALTVERFIWAPVEKRAQRRVPTVFRIVVAILIYATALLGVVSFVLDRTITSLLATSGVLALIIGLALQSNLKDIFSGVMINLERPFLLNDWVRINRTFGQVVDVSWRTTRLRTKRGQIISFANGRVVEAEIENLTRAGYYDATVLVHLDPSCAPEAVVAMFQRAMAKITTPPLRVYEVKLRRIDNFNGSWAAEYKIELWTQTFELVSKAQAAAWRHVWAALAEENLTWALQPAVSSEPVGETVAS